MAIAKADLMLFMTQSTEYNNEWSTPQDFYDKLNEEFHFELDPCATEENKKCPLYFDKDMDGLSQDWAPLTVFCNPPYQKYEIGKWVKKAYEESLKGCTVVMLLPASVGTKWFHEYCIKGEVRFIKGRLKFGGVKGSPRFDSILVVFKTEQLLQWNCIDEA